ncbi:GSCFA domain-containing protein [Shinella zoogloeoides]|uniref:GSCFA domain-containing protein n=1 Tax=Shinella zoogloeoides TaxID=352475 RepID=UPI00273F397B|nr:GSCFA domain-containing protein [Shinella zoogloeoides]WLR92955.1 GSCFA domain-containing protein [Shinella zoogloeoides]
MKIGWEEALAARRMGIACAKYPSRGDRRERYPVIKPRFTLEPNTRIFTIGSCFARNIERKLKGFDVPTLRFTTPTEETPAPSNALLNEYNPGTMSQRILFALNGNSLPSETIVPSKGGYLDLSLPGGYPVTLERALERRREVDTVYSSLKESAVVIVTLGFVEAWFDQATGLYLNQMPPQPVMAAEPNRFKFGPMRIETVMPLLEGAMQALSDAGLKVILTVSPVPIGSTFTGQDAVIANEYSKSVLRCAAQSISETFPIVDYFPSYEMVKMGGVSAYEDDNVHVKDCVVAEVTDYMLSVYAAI